MPLTVPTSREPEPGDLDAAADAAIPAIEASLPARYERVDLDRYAVMDGERVVGFVDVVPPVFVCYLGATLAHAVEVAQVHDFHRAVDLVIGAASTDA